MSWSGVPYQAYRSKRHSRNISTSSIATALSLDEKQAVPSISQSYDIGNGIAGSSIPPASTMLRPASSDSVASSTNSPTWTPATRPKSTVRRVPLRNLHSPLPTPSPSLRSPLPLSHSRSPSVPSTPPPSAAAKPLPVIDKPSDHTSEHPSSPSSSAVFVPSTGHSHSPPPKSAELVVQAVPSYSTRSSHSHNGSVIVSKPTHATGPSRSVPLIHQKLTPYRPGFQPKGVCHSVTDEFISLRCAYRNGEGQDTTRRIERTKLERRMEKLISLHFSQPSSIGNGTSLSTSRMEQTRPDTRRSSSTFDFDSIRGMDAGSIFKSIISGRTKDSIRDAEQRITPWQGDSAVERCPLCNASFHPLANRKHHCRLCGRIICALPPKRPHRPATCSLLFVLNPQSRIIEEVDEGVDYGVRRRNGKSDSHTPGTAAPDTDDEKFLKGVRICRECRPVLLKFRQEMAFVPSFVRFHKVLIDLEHEIEAALPQFHELVLSLSHNDTPTKEASAARKRLLDAFSEYDALSKRIFQLPCANGPKSTQHRVQAAVLARTNIFLQKNMFPLKSLPTERLSMDPTDPDSFNDAAAQRADDFELAVKLQPLLEQEALLESFIHEAEARRKFEDVKILKSNLDEIRGEIVKISESADSRASRKHKTR